MFASCCNAGVPANDVDVVVPESTVKAQTAPQTAPQMPVQEAKTPAEVDPAPPAAVSPTLERPSPQPVAMSPPKLDFRESFQVIVTKDKSHSCLGIEITTDSAATLTVSKLPVPDRTAGGAAQSTLHEFNQTAKQPIMVGDVIVSVNGETGNNSTMLNTLRESTTLRLDIVRHRHFTATLVRKADGEPLAMSTYADPDNGTFTVQMIKPVDSPVTRYNMGAPEKPVAVSDQVVEVNGATTVEAMLEHLKRDRELKVRIRRAA